jgi:hypothetical protein
VNRQANEAPSAAQRLACFREDMAGKAARCLDAFAWGYEPAGEVVRPLLVLEDGLEAAEAAGEEARLNELLDAARNDPAQIFYDWREHQQAERERAETMKADAHALTVKGRAAEANARELKGMAATLAPGPLRDRALATAAQFRSESVRLKNAGHRAADAHRQFEGARRRIVQMRRQLRAGDAAAEPTLVDAMLARVRSVARQARPRERRAHGGTGNDRARPGRSDPDDDPDDLGERHAAPEEGGPA